MQLEEVGAMGKTLQIRSVGKIEKVEGMEAGCRHHQDRVPIPVISQGDQIVNQVAKIAEQADHHPDILISFRKVTLSLSTHDEGGITQKDFSLAEQLEEADGKRSKEAK